MKLIRVNKISVTEFEGNNKFIPVVRGIDYNFYLVSDEVVGFERVENAPNLENFDNGSLQGVVKYVSYLSNEKMRQQIDENRKELDGSDYKVIKMYEYSLVGKERPYDIVQLARERQALRDSINTLQTQIKETKSWEELENVVVDKRKNI